MSRSDDKDLQARILGLLEDWTGRALGIRKLVKLLDLPAHANRRVRRLLKDLVGQGKAVAEGRGRYSLAGGRDELEGVLGRAKGKFVPVEAADGTVLATVGFSELGGALPGDRVLVEPTRRRSKAPDQGRVTGILARGKLPLVGVFKRQAKAAYLIPDDDRMGDPLLISDEGDLGAKDGQVVAAVIDDPRPSGRPRGRIVRVLGEPGSFATERERLAFEHGLVDGFPAEVEAELVSGPRDAAADERVDLRHVPLVTIDPPDAKDFDDAVYVEPAGKGSRLWVAIADVAAHVPLGSALDAEALRRGCSTYLPGRVFPMLPGALSEEACSLAPGLDRPAMVVELELDPTGRPLGGRVRRALIRSAARLTYQEVQTVIDGGEPSDRIRPHLEAIARLIDCAGLLLDRMRERGQLQFDLPEPAFELDAEGWPTGVHPAPHGLANRVIEACMVAANEVLARTLAAASAPVLYRVHQPPDDGRMEAFREVASALGHPPPFESAPSPRQVADYLASLAGKPVGPGLEQLLLRSLMQARYTADCQEHYGLASACYLHFTSPIRRYPDLVVHRQLGALLARAGQEGLALDQAPVHGVDPQHWPVAVARMAELGDACSAAERRAVDAERASAALYQAAWASDRIGQTFPGRITFTADFGLFVRLAPSGVEGLIHLARLADDYYDYDPDKLVLVGRRSGASYRVGQQVQVRIDSANLSRRQIDLAFAD